MALRWFTDWFGVYKDFGWGYSLWKFAEPFGIVEYDHLGAVYENFHGYKADRAWIRC
jgi:hypothetical protein